MIFAVADRAFDALVSSPTAWMLQYDAEVDEMRATKSAVGLMDLLETITGAP
jgi:hypothetical protein